VGGGGGDAFTRKLSSRMHYTTLTPRKGETLRCLLIFHSSLATRGAWRGAMPGTTFIRSHHAVLTKRVEGSEEHECAPSLICSPDILHLAASQSYRL
jgi:hypothetical protein